LPTSSATRAMPNTRKGESTALGGCQDGADADGVALPWSSPAAAPAAALGWPAIFWLCGCMLHN
jgi:hypothetical protein